MKAFLLFPDHDVDWTAPLVWNEQPLRQDLGLDTLLQAMANGDPNILSSVTSILLAADNTNIATIEYRQAMLKDCLSNPAALHELYAVATEAADKVKSHYLGVLTRYPHWVLSDAIEQMSLFVGVLRRLREIAERRSSGFVAKGWIAFFDMLKRELDDAYLGKVTRALETLKLRGVMVMSAELGPGNRATHYLLHQPEPGTWNPWLRFWYWLFPPKPPANSFSIHPRDEAGHRALEALRDQGIAFTATALAQSKDHVRHFFIALRAELAFYLGCLALHERLKAKWEPTCFPGVHDGREKRLRFGGLYDVGLSLSIRGKVVGNDADANGKGFVLITGANQGGKSTLLRSLGVAQLMMQAGMFVPAQSFQASVCDGVFTHYKREEDVHMVSGKFDEELARMSAIVDRLTPTALVLFNESFAATNEREGSEVARQIVTALLARDVRVAFVTHLYDFAHSLHESHRADGLFLRAERDANGARSFRLREGQPLPTSFGEDLYERVFGQRNAEKPRREKGPLDL
jgi:DNA mismatch repair ATPase MutS